MILVTVGTQLPFDRLIDVVDQWAAKEGLPHKGGVFAQIGPTKLIPKYIEWSNFIDAKEFRQRAKDARVIIAHAGMGSIITALELGKPIVVMPRRADMGEHRNDHQIATARHFAKQGRISVAFSELELIAILNRLDDLEGGVSISTEAEPRLIEALQAFINGDSI